MPAQVTLGNDRTTSADGRPFFLIGARHMPEGASPADLRDAGFNAYRTLAFGHESGDPEPIPDDLEGIYFWSYFYDRADFTKSSDHPRELSESVRRVREHPALLCYENYNEPTLLYKSDQFKTQPEDLAKGTAALRDLDKDHPIWLAHACGNTVDTLRRFNDCADIVGCNPYPVYVPGMRRHIGVREDGSMLDCPDSTIHAVGRYTQKMIAVGQNRKPVWMLIQAMANEHWFDPGHTPELAGQSVDATKVLYPTWHQMRFMAYDAIIAGATGLAFAMHKTPAKGQIWDSIRRLVGELRDLHDVLASPIVAQPVEIMYEDLGYTIWDGVITTTRHISGALVVIAANTAIDPARACIRLPPDAGLVADVYSEDRQIVVDGGSFTDNFEPHAVHVYQFEATG